MENKNFWLLLIFFQCFLVIGALSPVFGGAVEEIRADTVQAKSGETVSLTMQINLRAGWHVNAHQPEADFLIPTEITHLDTTVETIRIDYPPGEPYRLIEEAEPVKIYKEKFRIEILVNLPPELKVGPHQLEGRLNYQPCEDDRCDPPRETSFTIPLQVKNPGPHQPQNSNSYGAGLGGNILDNLEGGVNPLTLAGLFFLGLLMNLTPCVYPLIPVTVAFFGGKEKQKTAYRILDGFLFFLGLVIFYAVLGTVAGYTGGQMNRLFQFSAVQLTLSGLMVFLAGSSFGLYRFRIPGVQNFISSGKSGRISSIFMGSTLGLAAVPCVGPVVAALLAFVGQQGGLAIGFIYFLIFAAGFGLPYFLLAVFTPLLNFLPGSGGWLAWVEKGIGFLLLGMAIFFSAGLLPETVLRIIIYTWLAGALAGLAILHPPASKVLAGLRVLLLIILTGGALVGIQQWFFQPPAIDWETAQEYVEKDATSEAPVLFYVTADWCLPCRQIEANTFADEQIQKYNNRLNFVKADVTTPPPEPVEEWMQTMQIQGVPTLFFLDCEGDQLDKERITGYITPRELEPKLKSATDSC